MENSIPEEEDMNPADDERGGLSPGRSYGGSAGGYDTGLASRRSQSTANVRMSQRNLSTERSNSAPRRREGSEPILAGDSLGERPSAARRSQSSTGPVPMPNFTTDEPETTKGSYTTNMTSWLRGGKTDSSKGRVGGDSVSSDLTTKKNKHGKRITIQRWPYDDYHKVQADYYERLEHSETKENGHASDEDNNSEPKEKPDGYHSGSDDEDRGRSSTGVDDGSSFVERPKELPTIKDTVGNLPLSEFNKKAQERAIGIVSTWLFDSGLVDELLVNGAISRSSGAATTANGEGIEVGANGFPIVDGAGLKMDKEIDKLRMGAQRELSLVNASLNDGVAASGSEVQELVNAVTRTKGDLGSLRELTTYFTKGGAYIDPNEEKELMGQVSNELKKEAKDEFLLAHFPKLKTAVNARRNTTRCFRELEFFTQIPSTCDRLREELHSSEWTAEEWHTIRSVSMEHVELEILLIEAEAGMKAKARGGGGGGGDGYGRQNTYGSSSYGGGGGGKKNAYQSMEHVDDFLSEHVKNVWEMGEELRMRILSGIASAFELALQNPGGMVALVEAVEVYEKAAEQYGTKQEDEDAHFGNQSDSKLHFTNMRAAALAQLYEDFEMRCNEVFSNVHMQAAEDADEEDAMNEQYTAVLRGATELVAEIDMVQNAMVPCFPPFWAVDVLWTACVAHVCSSQILQQIGGPEAHNLPDLTVTQLLDVVAWVEFFRQTIEEAFPAVKEKESGRDKVFMDQRPDLFGADDKKVDVSAAMDSLVWAKDMLWEVHRLAQDEFLLRTRDQSEEWLGTAYTAEHEKSQSMEGRLATSLPEDVFSLAGAQLRTIRERLSSRSDALVMAICLIFSQLRSMQIHNRDNYLKDLETCCASANDFIRMSEQAEELLEEIQDEDQLNEKSQQTLEASSEELFSLYSNDAVYAAQCVHIHIFEPISEAIEEELFGKQWEEELTRNELALTLVRTLEDFMGDVEQYMDSLMVRKTVDALVTSSVIFYIGCLIKKSESHNSNKVPMFSDVDLALNRMLGDFKIMREYFEGLGERFPGIERHVEREFEVLGTVHELLSIAGGLSESDAADFIVMIQKRVKDVNLTKHFISDLWHLVSPTEERAIWELVESMEETMNEIAPTDDEAAQVALGRSSVPGLRLDAMMANNYMNSKRKRSVKASVAEKMMTGWQSKWASNEDDEDDPE